MTKNLLVAIVQANLLWEDIEGNINNFTQKLNSIKDNPHLVILPEMFTTGFSMNPEHLAEPENGPTTQWMLKMAKLNGFAICGSFIVKEDERYFNRFHFVTPNGLIYKYDKRHLFTFANENIKYTRGSDRLVFEYLGWRILPQICYDVRFPVWSRNKNDYDLIINVANFPGKRREIWSILLRARAIENQCYVAAANRVGDDELMISYTGDSQLINATGQPITDALAGEEKIIYGTFNIDELHMFRKKFPVLLDADDFTLNQ